MAVVPTAKPSSANASENAAPWAPGLSLVGEWAPQCRAPNSVETMSSAARRLSKGSAAVLVDQAVQPIAHDPQPRLRVGVVALFKAGADLPVRTI